MNVVLMGGGGHSSVIIDILEKDGSLKLVGILDPQIPLGERVLGYEVLGRDHDLPALASARQIQAVVVAIGDNWLRSKVVDLVRSLCPALVFYNVVHPAAQLGKGVRLGVGNIIMAGCVLNSRAKIGNFCILNTNCSIDHDGVVGDFASCAPNSCVGGSTTIGDFTAVCLGANIIDRLTIGAHTVVGAGATVLNSLPSHVVAYGTPARVIRPRSEGEKYL